MSNSTTTPPALSGTTGYLNSLQVCAAILAMILLGFVWRMFGKVPSNAPQTLNAYMFLVGIPTLVFRGLALQVFGRMPWSYVAVFFCLRIALFVIWALLDLLIRRRSLGEFVADYMNSTWINTVIFGIPIYVALYGPAFAVYPIFASISSFFFQLPVQLLLFEIDQLRKESASLGEDEWATSAVNLVPGRSALLRILGKVVLQVVVNPIVVAIVAGILWSVAGWPLPVFLDTLCVYTGDAVTPLAAFSIGVFMYQPVPKLRTFWVSFVISMVIKVFVMPLLVMPFLIAFGVTGAPRQMGVLMAALPVALSCYVLSLNYKQNEQLASWMVVGSTILMLPTQLMWIAITNSMGWGA